MDLASGRSICWSRRRSSPRGAALEASHGYRNPALADALAGDPARHGGQLANGMVLEPAVKYQKIDEKFGIPRDNH